MGASSSNKINNNPCVKPLLISFTRIKEFRDIFYKEPEKTLSKIFYLLCKDEKEVKTCVEDFNSLVKDKKGHYIGLNFHQLLDFILDTLNEELNENKHKDRDREKNIKDYAENFSEMTNSIIERLFFGSKQLAKTCKTCNRVDYNYEIFSKFYFDLTNNESNVDMKDLLHTDKEERKICANCNTKQDFEVKIKYLNLPEILIINFNIKEYNKQIEYYKNMCFGNEPFILTGFIMKKDEKDRDVEDFNVFFEENKKWYIYRTADNLKLEIADITDITGNPIVTFYKRDKIFYYDIYNETINLLKDQENIKDLINEHLVADADYEKYYLVNKNWYFKIIKIFEDEINYSKEGFINTEENIKNELKKKNVDLIMKYRLYSERKKNLKDEEKVDMMFENNLKVYYPKDFLLVKENVFNNFYNLIYSSELTQKYLYEVKFGENYIFIKDKIENKENNNNETIFVCYFNKNNNKIDVECILKYFNPCFDEEIEKYISNRGGIEYFYLKKELKLDEEGIQNIIDTKTKNTIGNLINIKNPVNHFDLGRYSLENKKDNCNNNNVPGLSIRMSMFEDDVHNNTGVMLSKNFNNFQNWNNFNMSNINMNNQVFNNQQN